MDSMKKMGKFDIDIEIKDMLWEFARRWRLIVVMAVVCGIALGAYQYRSDMNETVVVTVKKTQEELEKSMGEQDLGEVAGAVALYRQLDQKSDYMEESVLMRINPFEENAVILQYYVDADEKDVAMAVNDALVAYVDNNVIAQTITENGDYDLEAMYVAELISIAKDEGNVYINAEDATESIHLKVQGSSDEYSFGVKIVGATAEDASAIALDVKEALGSYSTSLTGTIGAHELQLLEESEGVFVDQNLAELQNWNATSVKTISNNLDKMKNEMTSDQISLYVYRTTVLAEENNIETSTSSTAEKQVSISMKHVIIGVVVGVILACVLAFVFYLFAAALRSSEEVKTLYNIKVLGCVDDSAFQKKKLFGFVDKLIEKLQNRRKKALTYEQEMKMVCANIVLDCQKNGYKEVFITSSVEEQIPEAVKKAIVDKCEEKGIRVVMGAAISYDAEALEALAKVGNVVFVEKKRVSLYDELYNEVALCKEHGIQVVGMVVLG